MALVLCLRLGRVVAALHKDRAADAKRDGAVSDNEKECPVCRRNAIDKAKDLCSQCAFRADREAQRDIDGPLKAYMTKQALFAAWLVEHCRD